MSRVISEGGERLRVFLDGTHVETRWIANYHVVWQTGQRNGPAQGDPAHHTHCSAYVAAAALYLDIYILRPPHHGQLHLANAQVSLVRRRWKQYRPYRRGVRMAHSRGKWR